MPSTEKYLSGPPAKDLDPTISFAQLFLSSIMNHDKEATAQIEVETGRQLTFGELTERCLSMAQGLLREGIGDGSIAVIVSFNSQEAHIMQFSCICIGATPAPIDPSLNSEELAALIKLVSPAVIYTENGKTLKKVEAALASIENEPLLIVSGKNHHTHKSFQSMLLPADPEFTPSSTNIEEHVALILFTSGTSGLPKAVMLPDAYLITNSLSLKNALIMTFFLTSPMFWLSGALLLFVSNIIGVKSVYFRGPVKEAVLLNTIQTYKVNFWMTAPTTLRSLLNFPNYKKYDLSSLKMVTSGGAILSAKSEQLIVTKLLKNRAMFSQTFGMTEVGGVSLHKPGSSIKLGSCGTLNNGYKVKIEDLETGESLGPGETGELCIKGQHIMLGYLKNPEATRATFDDEGWFHAGDIAYYDEDGYLYIIDRIKDLIKYKSYQIAPAELENVLRTHPGVKDVVVFGIPHATDGDHAVAYVVADNNVEENELLKYVAERVSENKQLRGGIRFVDFIPRTSTGKPKRRTLRSQLMAELKEEQ